MFEWILASLNTISKMSSVSLWYSTVDTCFAMLSRCSAISFVLEASIPHPSITFRIWRTQGNVLLSKNLCGNHSALSLRCNDIHSGNISFQLNVEMTSPQSTKIF